VVFFLTQESKECIGVLNSGSRSKSAALGRKTCVWRILGDENGKLDRQLFANNVNIMCLGCNARVTVHKYVTHTPALRGMNLTPQALSLVDPEIIIPFADLQKPFVSTDQEKYIHDLIHGIRRCCTLQFFINNVVDIFFPFFHLCQSGLAWVKPDMCVNPSCFQRGQKVVGLMTARRCGCQTQPCLNFAWCMIGRSCVQSFYAHQKVCQTFSRA
jgi:hypothetical protein